MKLKVSTLNWQGSYRCQTYDNKGKKVSKFERCKTNERKKGGGGLIKKDYLIDYGFKAKIMITWDKDPPPAPTSGSFDHFSIQFNRNGNDPLLFFQ
jgi:hypothetical protein